MSHVRAIAEVPTSDEPTGTGVQNPFASAGRPLYEVHISSVRMLGVIAESMPQAKSRNWSAKKAARAWCVQLLEHLFLGRNHRFPVWRLLERGIWSVFAPSTGKPGSLTNPKHTPIPAVLLPPLASDAEQDSEVS